MWAAISGLLMNCYHGEQRMIQWSEGNNVSFCIPCSVSSIKIELDKVLILPGNTALF